MTHLLTVSSVPSSPSHLPPLLCSPTGFQRPEDVPTTQEGFDDPTAYFRVASASPARASSSLSIASGRRLDFAAGAGSVAGSRAGGAPAPVPAPYGAAAGYDDHPDEGFGEADYYGGNGDGGGGGGRGGGGYGAVQAPSQSRPVKRGRGRPRKHPLPLAEAHAAAAAAASSAYAAPELSVEDVRLAAAGVQVGVVPRPGSRYVPTGRPRGRPRGSGRGGRAAARPAPRSTYVPTGRPRGRPRKYPRPGDEEPPRRAGSRAGSDTEVDDDDEEDGGEGLGDEERMSRREMVEAMGYRPAESPLQPDPNRTSTYALRDRWPADPTKTTHLATVVRPLEIDVGNGRKVIAHAPVVVGRGKLTAPTPDPKPKRRGRPPKNAVASQSYRRYDDDSDDSDSDDSDDRRSRRRRGGGSYRRSRYDDDSDSSSFDSYDSDSSGYGRGSRRQRSRRSRSRSASAERRQRGSRRSRRSPSPDPRRGASAGRGGGRATGGSRSVASAPAHAVAPALAPGQVVVTKAELKALKTAAAAAADGRAEADAALMKVIKGTRHQPPIEASLLAARGVKPSDGTTIILPGDPAANIPGYYVEVLAPETALHFQQLGISGERPAGFTGEAQAAAAFDTDEFISGVVRLPPRAMKDPETSELAHQIFYVAACQPRALQITIGDSSFLGSPGLHFFVPRTVVYQLVNHSADTEAVISFVLTKPSDGGAAAAAAGGYAEGEALVEGEQPAAQSPRAALEGVAAAAAEEEAAAADGRSGSPPRRPATRSASSTPARATLAAAAAPTASPLASVAGSRGGATPTRSSPRRVAAVSDVAPAPAPALAAPASASSSARRAAGGRGRTSLAASLLSDEEEL